jgi:hypothetical protein
MVTFSIYWSNTNPGRSAASLGEAWPVVDSDRFNDVQQPVGPNDTDQFGKASATIEHGHLVVHYYTLRDATDFWAPNPTPLGDFYAEVRVKKLPGAADAFCGLVFRFTDPNRWIAFKIREHEFAVTSAESSSQHHVFVGPEVSTAIRSGSWNKLAILARGSGVAFYVNGEKLVDQVIAAVPGSVQMAVQAPNRPSNLACAFGDFLVRAPRR